MKWNNLKEYCCPKCGFQLNRNDDTRTHECSNCEFQINDMRFTELVNEIYQPMVEGGEEEDNTSMLYD